LRTARQYSWSTWTRGQARGMFGFANSTQYPDWIRMKLERYLQTVRRVSKLFPSRIPPSGIVPWFGGVGWSEKIDLTWVDAPIDPPRPGDAYICGESALLTLLEQELGIHDATGAQYYADGPLEWVCVSRGRNQAAGRRGRFRTGRSTSHRTCGKEFTPVPSDTQDGSTDSQAVSLQSLGISC
jgi:hypothetical protein